MSVPRRKDLSSLLNGRIKQAVRSLNINRVSMKVGDVFTMSVSRSGGAPIAALQSSDPATLGIAHLGGGKYVLTALAAVSQVVVIMKRTDFGGGQFAVSVSIQIVP